jgi:hypothetical protein
MLHEISDVRQVENDDFRRWFMDEFFDLIVWYDKRNRITGFQLCYDKIRNEHALTWRSGRGFIHTRIDDGERPGSSKMSPILVADGAFDKMSIAEHFKRESGQIDPEIAAFVFEKVMSYPEGR